jgi:hypothetical protein
MEEDGVKKLKNFPRRALFPRNYLHLLPINYDTCLCSAFEEVALSKIYFSFKSAFNVTQLINISRSHVANVYSHTSPPALSVFPRCINFYLLLRIEELGSSAKTRRTS